MKPYFEADGVQLYLGDCRDVLPALGLQADVVIADPPYGETSLPWDRWPEGWPVFMHGVSRQLWCFGSMRMFLGQHADFDGWRFAQDVIWEKQQGSGPAADRFQRVHEHVTHWYRGGWADLYRDPQRESGGLPAGLSRRRAAVGHKVNGGHLHGDKGSTVVGDGTRLVRSVIRVRNLRGAAEHPTEKPAGILRPLVAYSSPVGGLVLDPFAGSGSTLAVAREMGRRAVGIEADERYCEIAARRLAAAPLPLGEAS
ncbi:site-specific DNA-methyltransferase [Frankia sp. AgW1.1]|uniref:DNA-methyltransferase n=1 Tax=Frankia sp. AgW1.1 TaxID=1836971 RepID=UPI001931B98F|nr:site-specific DNA-methyltransferase [Frankia sp. AgW1.1]MBL7487145.1 site-specific DNA-methyltransferase [Frankia sp. AgW1.1]